MEDLIVCKYGGSSITTNEDLKRIGNISRDDLRRRVIVVSAPGKRNKSDTKVTDMLIKLGQTKSDHYIDQIVTRYRELGYSEHLKGFRTELFSRVKESLEERAYMDNLKAFGEEGSAIMFEDSVGFEFVDPRELFLVTNDFGNAKILSESKEMIRENLGRKHESDKNKIFVVPGFYGFTADGKRATFSRGGSDLTGAYLAASLGASVYENFTDKEGVFSASPDLIENPHKIDELTFNEMRDLSYSGFGIFHQEAVEPVQIARIPVHIRGTFDYPKRGTYVAVDRICNPDKPIVGIAYRNNFCSFNVTRPGLDDRIGIVADVLGVFKQKKISIEHVTTGIDDISILMDQTQFKNGLLSSVISGIYDLIGDNSEVRFSDNLGCLVIAGKGLRGKRGISANIQKELDDDGVNIRVISQGEQERCIVYGIASEDGERAVKGLYERYLR
ncbi:putative aspartokinase [uncultured archaeon]|nr:putative aspartokinase [uncultured archaeon]